VSLVSFILNSRDSLSRSFSAPNRYPARPGSCKIQSESRYYQLLAHFRRSNSAAVRVRIGRRKTALAPDTALNLRRESGKNQCAALAKGGSPSGSGTSIIGLKSALYFVNMQS
jgi:hypothetical protein